MMKINYLHVAFLSFMLLQNLTAHSKPTAYEGFNRGNATDSTIPIRYNAIHAGCRQEDSLQLIRLYQTANGANWTRKWLLNTPINTWAGVVLTPEGCVKNLNLTRNQLVGTIPNLNLPKLQTLILVDNALTGVIPSFNLPELRVLNLSLNQLTGAIPVLLLPQLMDLHLNFNRFTGAIPVLLSPNLKFLHLEGNLLSGAIPAFAYPLLEILQLRTNRLTGTIPNFNFPRLRSLHLELNFLTGTIPNFSMPFLRELFLDNNQLTGAIPNFNLPLLETLGLETNRLTGEIPNFNLMPKLKLVLLARNRLTGTIPHFNFPHLLALQLNNNRLTGCIPIGFKSFCAKVVDLSGNTGLQNQNFATFCSGNVGSCTPILPDLTMANLNLTSPMVSQGQVLNHKFDLKNIGSGNATSRFNVKCYISTDNVLSTNDILSGIVPTANFAAGFSVLQVPSGAAIPATLAAGPYYLILKADADNQIVENNENNNLIVSLPFQVTVPNPTLVIITPLKTMVYEQKVKLDWVQTTDSIAHFELQKLKQNGSEFETIHRTIAESSDPYHRSYDELPVEGVNEYRLKTILKNGKIGYSPTQKVDYQKLTSFTIFPNPTSDDAFVDLKDFENLKVEIAISDVAGKVLLKQIIQNASLLPHRLNVSQLEKGTYLVHIQSVGKRAVTQKLHIL